MKRGRLQLRGEAVAAIACDLAITQPAHRAAAPDTELFSCNQRLVRILAAEAAHEAPAGTERIARIDAIAISIPVRPRSPRQPRVQVVQIAIRAPAAQIVNVLDVAADAAPCLL